MKKWKSQNNQWLGKKCMEVWMDKISPTFCWTLSLCGCCPASQSLHQKTVNHKKNKKSRARVPMTTYCPWITGGLYGMIFFTVCKITLKDTTPFSLLIYWFWKMFNWKQFPNQVETISKLIKKLFVHDGINSVADYNLLRVGVGCMSYVVCMYVCPEANFTIG